MKAANKMFACMVKQITREMMMILLVAAPFIIGAVFRFGVPALESLVLSRFGMEKVLVPYYELFSWLLAIVTCMLFEFTGGLVILGETDDNVAKYVLVTPAGMWGYLYSRIVLPALISGALALILVPAFALEPVRLSKLIVMVISSLLGGIVTAFLVVAVSANKVEGMAVGKLSGLFGVTFFLPLLVKGSIRYAFSIFPMFWIGEWYICGKWYYLVIATIEFAAWIAALMYRFRKKFE